MPRPLLTSSQVSALVSTGIVLVFTTALFLSGYAIQQRTLRQLRAAIKQPAKPSPRVILPDRFKSQTTELEDGTIVIIESQAERDASESHQIIEVRPTLPDEPAEKPAELPGAPPRESSQEPIIFPETPKQEMPESQRAPAEDLVKEPVTEEAAKPARVLEIDPEHPKRNQWHPDPEAKDQRPISRAERRRLIKQEISRLSRLDEPMYYQRRLW